MANISHEIRTPLHVLIGLGNLLRRDPDQPVQMQRVEQLCATSDHLLSLVNDILDLSKIEAGRFVLDDSVFRLGSVIDHVQEVIAQLASGKDLMLITDIAPASREATLRGDPLRLSQILINLGGNAVKFSDRGAIHICVAVLEGSDASLCLRFSVQDNGIGIAPEDHARIFQPFEQIDGSITREYGGTGLGLAISQRLVSMMGGTIQVDSQLGAGSTFSFDITLQRDDSAPKPRWNMASAPDLTGMRVLVAEDHPLSQEIILEMLEDLGCLVEIATDGAEAVECAKTQAYDLILMDMQMPRMDGLEATRAIRELPGYRHKPIIALTANAFVEDRQRCHDAGMNDHISKPLTSAKLAAALSHWLPALAVPVDEDTHCECELSLALAKIPGLDVGQSWRQSPERLTDYCALLDKFVKMHCRDITQLRRHLEAGEHNAAHAIAHNLKGIAGLIGAKRVEQFATELSQALRSGSDQTGTAILMAACEAELMLLTEAIRTLPVHPAESAAIGSSLA